MVSRHLLYGLIFTCAATVYLAFQNCSIGPQFNSLQMTSSGGNTGNGNFYDGIVFVAGKCSNGEHSNRIQYSFSLSRARLLRLDCLDLGSPRLLQPDEFSITLGAEPRLVFNSIDYLPEGIATIKRTQMGNFHLGNSSNLVLSTTPLFSQPAFDGSLVVCTIEYTSYFLSPVQPLNSVLLLEDGVNAFRRSGSEIRPPDPTGQNQFGRLSAEIWYAENVRPSSLSMTVKYAGASDFHDIYCFEYIGVSKSQALAGFWSSGGLASPNIPIGPANLGAEGSLLLGALWIVEATYNVQLPPSFTRLTNTWAQIGDLILPALGSRSPLYGSADNVWFGATVNFNARSQ